MTKTFEKANIANIPSELQKAVDVFNDKKTDTNKNAMLKELRKVNAEITLSVNSIYVDLLNNSATDADFETGIKAMLTDSYNIYKLDIESKSGNIYVNLKKKVPTLWEIERAYIKTQKHKNKRLLLKQKALDALNILYRDLLNKEAFDLESNNRVWLKDNADKSRAVKSISALRDELDAVFVAIGVPSLKTRPADVRFLLKNISKTKTDGNKAKNKGVSLKAFIDLIQTVMYHKHTKAAYDTESNNKAVEKVNLQEIHKKLRDIA